MQALPTGVYGPLPAGTVGLLLGRSSTTMKGLLVTPGVFDADYTGEIKIMAHSPNGIAVVQTGTQIAQLILLPLVKTGEAHSRAQRGNQGFGSSDAYWIQAIGPERPEFKIKIEGKSFKGILDTGADVSVIAEKHWPTHWPKQKAISTLQGIGQATSPEQSAAMLKWVDSEGHQGEFQPYILPELPVNLWGRDIMKNMGVYLHSPNQKVSNLIMDQGMLPHQGLGVNSQGITEPIQPNPRPYRTGLGYF